MIDGGFFLKEETKSGARLSRLTGCAACKLHHGCLSPKMPATGRGEKGILVIAESPGETEDRLNKQLVGEAGQFLRKKLAARGIDLDRDCRKINAVNCFVSPKVCVYTSKGYKFITDIQNCRPAQNRTPTSDEIMHCRPRVWEEIAQFKPHAILLLGGPAIESFLGNRWMKKIGGISRWRGYQIPDRGVTAWVCPTFHPSYVLRSIKQKQNVIDIIFEQDLDNMLSKSDMPFPTFIREQSLIERIKKERDIYYYLNALQEWRSPMSLDFETTGLKPQAKGHKIVTCAITTSFGIQNGQQIYRTIAFPMPKEGATRDKLREVLSDGAVPKRAHNMKFEDTWSEVFLGTKILGWEWDTMLAAHVQDNRPKTTSLKFQAYVNFGIIDYDSAINDLLKHSDDKLVGNGLNRIDEIPLDDLLTYNGMDSLITYKLSELQMAASRSL